jgi:hypothetical protein
MTGSAPLRPFVVNGATTLMLAALLAGCGTGPTPALGGAWNLTASYGGGGLSCTVLATLMLNGSGSALSGTFAERQADCTFNGTPTTITLDTADVLGTADGSKVSFTPQPGQGESPCALFRYQGQATDERMSGKVQTIPVFCQGTYVELNGTWQADRP